MILNSTILKITSLLVRVVSIFLLTETYSKESFIATLIISIPEFWNSLCSNSKKMDDVTKNDAYSNNQKELQAVIPILGTFLLLLLLQPKNFDSLILKMLISKSEVILQYTFEILKEISKKRLRKYFRNRK